MFPEERLYSADLGTVGTQSLPREAVGSFPQYLPVGITAELGPSQAGFPRGQDMASSASWERTPAAWGGSPTGGTVGGKCPLPWSAGWQHLS